MYEAVDDDDYEEPINKGGFWTNGERSRFKKALQEFGFGRWSEVQKNAKIERWGLSEIECYARAFVRHCCIYAEEENVNYETIIEQIENRPVSER